MPLPLGAGGIMFSGCPSVRPKPEIPSFYLYMGLLVHPTNRDRFTACPSVRPSENYLIWRRRERSKYAVQLASWQLRSNSPKTSVCLSVRPSVRPERFPGICRRTHGGNGLKFYMLMYLDHLQNWLVYGHSLLIFLILALFWLGFPVISWRTHEGNGLKFCMLMYLDHLQNWLDFGLGLLNFVILALFWLSETGQIWGFRAFPGERMEEMAWDLACWCILTTFTID